MSAENNSFVDTTLLTMGLGSPTKRGVAAGSITLLLTQLVRPSISYHEDGTEREFFLFSEDVDSTYVPWWSLPIASAVIIGLFV